ncbi:MAG TPA: hypothetical protein VGD88_06145 [Opitutaceae bacterium]
MHTTEWDGTQAAAQLGVTKEWVSKLRSGKGTFSETMKCRIRDLERLNSVQSAKVEESQADYGMPSGRVEDPSPDRQKMRINPSFALPPPAPTRAEIEKYLAAYLDLAEQLPGGIPGAFFEVTEALPIERLRRRLEKLKEAQ